MGCLPLETFNIYFSWEQAPVLGFHCSGYKIHFVCTNIAVASKQTITEQKTVKYNV